MTGLEIVLEYLPKTIVYKIEPVPNVQNIQNRTGTECTKCPECIEEIRLRASKPLMIKTEQGIEILEHIVSQQEVLQAFERICENSVYSYRRQICDGYITIKGGNRVGVVGSAVIENGQVININYISSLNFRIARQIIGCSDFLLKDIINMQEKNIYNTLIISPPGCGKTTLLRDIIRNLSNGNRELGFEGKTVGIVDERGEIAAMYKGIPQNDIGIRTDVIDNMPKAEGMKKLVRSMSPDIIACDEIGGTDDIEAIDYVMCSGIKGIFTAHGKDIDEINKNPELSKLLCKHVFERIILLNPLKRGDAKCIYL